MFHNQSTQINLLAIANTNTDESAHLMLILNLKSMLKAIKNFNREKEIKKINFCTFCLQKNSDNHQVIAQHEKFCLSNPDSNHYKDSSELTNILEFEDEPNFLKCSDKGRSPPNWIGFVDFETVACNSDHLKQDVCDKHRRSGLTNCKCPISEHSENIKSLSYALIIIDFNTHEVLSEIFYIQKSPADETVPEHFVSTLKQF